MKTRLIFVSAFLVTLALLVLAATPSTMAQPQILSLPWFTDPNRIDIQDASIASSSATSQVVHIVSDANVKYSETLVPDWETNTFDDSTWLTVVAPSAGLCDPSVAGRIPNSPALPVWGQNPQQGQTIYSRKAFLVQYPISATVQTLVDDDFDLYVNGVLVRSDWDGTWSYYQDDVSTMIRGGMNVIALKARDSAGGCQHLAFDITISQVTEPTYFVSGRVRDESNNPVSGVVVSAGTGGSATTNASGYYTITGLVTGTYTLTPTKSGYTFSPPSRTVSVPPSATGQDFTAYAITPGQPPIVFVHGFGGLGLGMFSGIGCTELDKEKRTNPEDADNYFGPLDQLLAQARPVYFARLVSNRCYTPPFNDNVPYLMEAIDEAKQATGQSKVILVAHSMGGLVSRAYIESSSQYRGDVEALFTLGSPHHGVPHDLLTFTANGFAALGDLIFDWGTFCEDRQPGMCQFSITDMDIFNQDYVLNPDVKYYFLTGDAPTLSRNPIGLATDVLFLFRPNDGIVGLDSGKGDSLTVNPHVWLNRYTNDENHNIFGTGALYDWPYFGPRWNLLTWTNSKTYAECLRPVLVEGTQTTCASTVRAASAADASPAFSRTPFEGGTLLPGEIATRTLTVDGGLALFAAQWHTGTLTMTLIAPDNQVIDPTYAASNPSVVSYTASATGAAYYLPNALGGAWQVVVQAGSVPLTGTAYSTLAGFATDLTLTGGADRLWYSPGATATLTAALGGSSISAWVTATVFAGSITTTLPLSPTGGGQYQGDYAVPAASGYAAIQLRATGVNTASLPFEREFGFAFQISPQSLALNGIYSDVPHPRIPGVPLYQALTVTAGITATISGTVGLSADLIGASGDLVAHGLAILNVTTGTHTLSLRFDGDDIYAAGQNGPYTMTNLLLTDQRGATLAVAEAKNVYTTAAYSYLQFSPLPHYFGSSKSSDKTAVATGNMLTYTLLVRNPSDANLFSVVVTDTIPTGTAYITGSAWASSGTITETITGTFGIRWSGVVSANQTVTLTFQVSVTALAGSVITNTATINDNDLLEPAIISTTTSVTYGALASIAITPTSVTLAMRQSQQFSAAGFDAYNNTIPDLSLSWQVTQPDAGTIDATGLFTAGTKAGQYPDAVVVSSGIISKTADVIVRWPNQVYLPVVLR